MTWSFSASGPKEQCLSMLHAGTPPDDPPNARQYDEARAVIRDELARYEDGSAEMSISASGHAPGEGGGDRSFSIWISGKAAARAPAKTAARAPASSPTPPQPAAALSAKDSEAKPKPSSR